LLSVRINVDALLAESAEIEEEERLAALDEEGQSGSQKKRKARAQSTVDGDDAGELNTEGPPKPKRRRIKKEKSEQDVTSATSTSTNGVAAVEKRLPMKIRIKPMIQPKPIIQLPPCCLCTSFSREGLLLVHDPPAVGVSTQPARYADQGEEIWEAHENCAMVIPETWVDELDGIRYVWGVDVIVKDRWNLVRHR